MFLCTFHLQCIIHQCTLFLKKLKKRMSSEVVHWYLYSLFFTKCFYVILTSLHLNWIIEMHVFFLYVSIFSQILQKRVFLMTFRRMKSRFCSRCSSGWCCAHWPRWRLKGTWCSPPSLWGPWRPWLDTGSLIRATDW